MGSLGDTLPFVVLGRALRDRGHRVTLIGDAGFIRKFPNEGFEYAESLTEAEFKDYERKQTTLSDRARMGEMAQLMLGQVPKVYRLIEERFRPGETVVMAQGYALGARVAQEKLGVPLATVHLQPLWFRSVYDPVDAPAWLPRGVVRGVDRIIDFFADRTLGPQLNEFRSSLGLPPVRFIMKHWWNSPRLVLGMFPDWFNAAQPDYPPQTRLVGFPLPAVNPDEALPAEVEQFLEAGEPPLLFVNTAITKTAERYFETSIAVAQKLGRRAILISPHRELLPATLPPGSACFGYVPLAMLLPRCLLHVHHGGIGTIAHTLAAGIPQLTVPMGYDQPDNSKRLARLGASGLLLPKQYTVDAASRIIDDLLSSSAVREKCALFARRIAESDTRGECCDLAERLCEQPVAC